MSITKTIRSAEFDSLATAVATAGTNEKAFDAIKRLAAFVDVFIMAQRHLAVEEYKARITQLGMAVVNRTALETVLTTAHIPFKVEREFNSIWTKELETTFNVDALEPPFIVNDPDLQTLLNDTAVEPEVDLVALYQTRYRMYVTIDNMAGRTALSLFTASALPLKECISTFNELSTNVLFAGFEEEFKITIDADTRRKWLDLTRDELRDALHRALPNAMIPTGETETYMERLHSDIASHAADMGIKHHSTWVWVAPEIQIFAEDGIEYIRFEFKTEKWFDAFREMLAGRISRQSMARAEARSQLGKYQLTVEQFLLETSNLVPPDSAIAK